MKTSVWLVRASVVLLAATASYDASALGSLADVTVIDRDSGAKLSTYYYQGEYWVTGRPGARYAIEIRNCTEGRLLAVTSVDGVNVISGATAAWQQTGYVFDPWERYQVTGWRKSNEEVAAFFFTDLSNSYAARTGRAANVGVIGLALFRERQPQPVYSPSQIAPFASGDSVARNAPAPAPAPRSGIVGGNASSSYFSEPGSDAASAQTATASAAAPLAETARSRAFAAPPAPSAKLGTGHGAREYSYVRDTEFVRSHPEPDEVIRIRYDSLENLVAMGIVPPSPPGSAPATPNPFPRSHERRFVPDPPG